MTLKVRGFNSRPPCHFIGEHGHVALNLPMIGAKQMEVSQEKPQETKKVRLLNLTDSERFNIAARFLETAKSSSEDKQAETRELALATARFLLGDIFTK